MTGWDQDQAGAITLHFLRRLQRQWQKYPPQPMINGVHYRVPGPGEASSSTSSGAWRRRQAQKREWTDADVSAAIAEIGAAGIPFQIVDRTKKPAS